MLVVVALQNTAYTENKCLVLMNKKEEGYDCCGHASFVFGQP